jgi:hypothetical protein
MSQVQVLSPVLSPPCNSRARTLSAPSGTEIENSTVEWHEKFPPPAPPRAHRGDTTRAPTLVDLSRTGRTSVRPVRMGPSLSMESERQGGGEPRQAGAPRRVTSGLHRPPPHGPVEQRNAHQALNLETPVRSRSGLQRGRRRPRDQNAEARRHAAVAQMARALPRYGRSQEFDSPRWLSCGRGAAGSASPCQGEGRGFEPRRPLSRTNIIERRWTRSPTSWS